MNDNIVFNLQKLQLKYYVLIQIDANMMDTYVFHLGSY